MFFFLSKIFDLLLTPLLWVFLLLILSFFLKKRPLKTYLFISGLGILYLFSNHLVVNSLLQWWEKPPLTLDKNETYDVAIILTGITDNIRQPHDRIYFNKGAERITTPLVLYKKGIVKNILITGGTGSYNTNAQAEAELLKKFLIDNNVPSNAIFIENKAMNTYQNALYTKQFLENNKHLKSKLLITSSFHMRRSIACFNKQNIDFTPYPVDFYSSNSNLTLAKLLLPNAMTFQSATKLIHEVAGYLVYKLIGYS